MLTLHETELEPWVLRPACSSGWPSPASERFRATALAPAIDARIDVGKSDGASQDASIRTWLTSRRVNQGEQYATCAVAEGELPPGVDTGSTAALYATVAYGISLRAGDGASRAALMAAVDGAMAAWETLTSIARRRRPRPLEA